MSETPAAIHVVDDDADFRDALVWLFDSRGHQVQAWASGEVFLDAVRGQSGPV
jgi:two-component system, LuxR family, response regulator DctR